MNRIITPQLGRRHVVRGLAAIAAAALVPGGRPAAAAEGLVATPAQTVGPFYPTDWGGDADNDLVRVVGEAAQAQGQITHVLGRILDASGSPIPGAAVEIWQCDATGIYRHPRDTHWFRERDARFQGRGRATADARGAYSFRTIKPVAYPGRTPHIHFSITAPGRPQLITQMYVAGDPQNERDGILNGIRDSRQRDSVVVRLEPGEALEAGALVGTFDIVLAG
jgi:protocatechuate 3,4-dioxygenase beta subunit